MKPIVGVWLGCLLFLIVAADLGAQDNIRETPYYPLRVGTTWHYRSGESKFTIRVARHEKVGDTLCAALETKRGDKVVGSEHVAVAADGVYRHTLTFAQATAGARPQAPPENAKKQQTLVPPLLILKLPPKTGDSWKVDSRADGKTFRGGFQVDEQEIKVPAGSYKTFRVASQDLEVNALKPKITTFFAEGVGMVKQIIEVGDAKVEIELEKFSPASSQ